MSFWQTQSGEDVSQSSGAFEAGGSFEPIPKGQNCRATVESINWSEAQNGIDEGTQYIEATWCVIAPEKYANRKIFQKLWVYGKPSSKDPEKKRGNDLRMLAAINVHARGNPLPVAADPTDSDLAKLLNTIAMLTLDVYTFTRDDGTDSSGNWVRSIQAASNQPASTGTQTRQVPPAQHRKPAAKPAPASKPAPQAPEADDFDDEIPF